MSLSIWVVLILVVLGCSAALWFLRDRKDGDDTALDLLVFLMFLSWIDE